MPAGVSGGCSPWQTRARREMTRQSPQGSWQPQLFQRRGTAWSCCSSIQWARTMTPCPSWPPCSRSRPTTLPRSSSCPSCPACSCPCLCLFIFRRSCSCLSCLCLFLWLCPFLCLCAHDRDLQGEEGSLRLDGTVSRSGSSLRCLLCLFLFLSCPCRSTPPSQRSRVRSPWPQ